MTAVLLAISDEPVDRILAAAFLAPWILAGIGALLMKDDDR